jgi:hypothetical protein
MVQPNDDFLSAPELGYDGFIAALRENWGCFSPARGTNIFAGRVRARRVFGFAAVDLACNTVRVDRTELDIRRDDMAYYFVVAQLTGGSTIIQNDRVVNAAAGELVLLDSTRPVTFAGVRQAQWLGLQLPRQNLVSHLGFEPQGGTCGRGQAQAAQGSQLAAGSKRHHLSGHAALLAEDRSTFDIAPGRRDMAAARHKADRIERHRERPPAAGAPAD